MYVYDDYLIFQIYSHSYFENKVLTDVIKYSVENFKSQYSINKNK